MKYNDIYEYLSNKIYSFSNHSVSNNHINHQNNNKSEHLIEKYEQDRKHISDCNKYESLRNNI